MGPLEILLAGRELISMPERWTKHHYARDSTGRERLSSDQAAICWCSIGAISKAGEGHPISKWGARTILRDAIGGTISQFNDAETTTHADVLAAWDRAIERARADG